MFLAPFLAIPIFIRLGLYRAVIRFMEDRVLVVVAGGTTLSVLLLAALAALTHSSGLSRGVLGIYWLLAIVYVGATRFLARSYFLARGTPAGFTKTRRDIWCWAFGNATGAGFEGEPRLSACGVGLSMIIPPSRKSNWLDSTFIRRTNFPALSPSRASTKSCSPCHQPLVRGVRKSSIAWSNCIAR